MRKTITIICVLTIILPVVVWGYVSGLKSWVNDEVLTHTDLNSVVNDLNDGLDDVVSDISDSLDVVRSALNDTINARLISSFPIYWTGSFADSTAVNDSLTIEITKKSPIGTKQALYVDNQQGVAETVTMILDGVLPSKIARLDSIRFNLWTETTDSTDFVTVNVYNDSTTTHFKGVAAKTVNTLCSGTARTTSLKSITGINITGTPFRITFTIQTVSDSLFVGEVKAFVTNP